MNNLCDKKVLAAALLWDKKATAAALNVSTRTLDRARARGEISAVKLGGAVRFEPEEIERFIHKSREQQARGQ
jgi:excisionase family DNA binding protein